MMELIKQFDDYRIIATIDELYNIDDLKGDCFNPSVNYDICADELKADEIEFERLVETEGVWIFTLERWNPAVGCGWEVIDSCGGFVGLYNEYNGKKENHYIVDEFLVNYN